MKTIFTYDQSTDMIEHYRATPKIKKYDEGVCLGLSQLWLKSKSQNMLIEKFRDYALKRNNQESIVEWMDAQDRLLSNLSYDYWYKKGESYLLKKGGCRFDETGKKADKGRHAITNVNTPQGRLNNKESTPCLCAIWQARAC